MLQRRARCVCDMINISFECRGEDQDKRHEGVGDTARERERERESEREQKMRHMEKS